MRRLEKEDSDTGMEVSVQTVTNLSLSVRGNDKKNLHTAHLGLDLPHAYE